MNQNLQDQSDQGQQFLCIAVQEAIISDPAKAFGQKLAEVQALVADPASQPFTVTALRNGLVLGLTESEMRLVVLRLFRRDSFKAMTSHADQHVWQDAYHGRTEDGIPVYIKIPGVAGDRPPVIQFKAK